MPINIQPHVLPVLFGTLPPSFAEQVSDRMCFHEEGDNILICNPGSMKLTTTSNSPNSTKLSNGSSMSSPTMTNSSFSPVPQPD